MKRNVLVALIVAFTLSLNAQVKKTFSIQADKPTAKVSPNMWGVFFEDINLGADGGIYAELIKNRSFEFAQPLMGWKKIGETAPEGTFLVLNQKEKTNNPRFLRINRLTGAEKLGLQNEGFRGMGIKQGLRYDFSVFYRQIKPGVKLHIELVDTTGTIIGKGEFSPDGEQNTWKKQQVSFHATQTELKAKLNIWFEGKGIIDLDMISLFPEDTWKKRPGGLRADMVQLLADMKPGFIRFPGGCIVEGRELATRFQWKKTVGPIEDRQLIINRWNTEFKHRPAPDYYQTFGLGFFEYFQLAEDIGAEPLPILNCGMACQFNTAELVPIDELDEYVQDALDLIEFANGDVTTKWGKLRASMGHPNPFNLKMLGVGNENWGPQYIERLEIFKKALNDRYPNIKIVASSGTDPDGERFDFLNQRLRAMKVDFIDEHYYRSPEWFLSNTSRYDSYDRNGSKIFAGEYAGHPKQVEDGPSENNWSAAIAEAAFLTGLERNADVVEMASYAPLFAHVDGWQWAPDLIWVNNLHAYGTPNYQVQKLYATNKGTDVIPILSDGQLVSGRDSLYASAVIDHNQKEIIVKIVNHNAQPVEGMFNIQVKGKLASNGSHTFLTATNLNAINTIDQPDQVSPQTRPIAIEGKKLNISLVPYSFHVVKIKMQ
ncbi:alpha-L-arabinofuranosidase C-terminal domain-containing protein [Olivibacter domesticus]|uniref:non-reducing end alpha-L-arabinofuranosidase n=1 Tax=Olivibacter domesticus TaxID=407022 RepID=A0A1H7TQ63_OLID1|nr:alpha-L-arabinofuranosidase C-terminal domain-containing protein [Olivibacter domesticus]SEL86506.1 Alpha-L-arabinofuranosidase [Olivibacter domesticus]